MNIDKKLLYILLITTSKSKNLSSIPNIDINLILLEKLIKDETILGIPQANIFISHNDKSLDIKKKLISIGKRANTNKHTLLIYYSGHGLINRQNFDLHLTSSETEEQYLEDTSISIERFKKIIKNSFAGRKIIILDCCFSGRISGILSEENEIIITQLKNNLQGTYILTSSGKTKPSTFNEKNPNVPTDFTKSFINILENGIDNTKEYIELGEIYNELKKLSDRKIIPEPFQISEENSYRIKLFRNRRYIKRENIRELIQENEKNDEFEIKDNYFKQIEYEKKSTYIQELANRLMITKEYLSLRNDTLTYSKICDNLNYEYVSLIENYFTGEKEAPKDFLIKYSGFFGLEFNWLRYGEDNIFKIYDQHLTYPLKYKEWILESNPLTVFYIRKDSQEGQSGIILQLTDKKYIIVPRKYNISSMVGGTGQLQMVSFYKLIIELDKLPFKKAGLILEEKNFDDLFSGMIYPGKLFEKDRQGIYWWDDLLDIFHKYPISKNYEQNYGTEFIKAQEIIKQNLSSLR